jgi:hypothetical protein
LWLPISDKYHVSSTQQGSQVVCPFAELDGDITNGLGPETITITQAFSGQYTYAVHKESNDPIRLANAGAVVRVIEGTETLATFNVPTSGTTEKWWHVFDLSVDTSGAWQLTPVDTLQHPSPGPYSEETGACSPAA